jgi:hypothetical protein
VKDSNSNKALGCIAFGEIKYDLDDAVSTDIAAFQNCHGLKSVEIITTAGQLSIAQNCFSDCENLVSAKITNVYDINVNAFANCSNLTSIDFNDNSVVFIKSTIYEYAFAKCSKLQFINLPERFTNIKAHAFEYCLSLQIFEFYEDGSIDSDLNSELNIEANAFDYCNELSLIVIFNKRYGIINSDAFSNMPDATNGTILSTYYNIDSVQLYVNSLVDALPKTSTNLK